MLKRPHWQLSILSGILIGLSYPPLHLGFLAYIGLIPLIYVLLKSKPKQSIKQTFLASITANFISLYWIGFNSGAGFIPVFASLVGAIIYLSIFWIGFGLIVSLAENKYSKGLVITPFAWVAMELNRSLGSLGFPWINLALTQTEYLSLIQIADITGTYGIAFWIILINIGFYLTITSKNKIKYLIVTAVLFLVMFMYGTIRINTFEFDSTESIKIAITQPNINPDEKWDPDSRDENFAIMHDLLDSALSKQPDLVLWPESAVPAYLRISRFRRKPIADKLINAQIPLLSGTVDRIMDDEKNKFYYNSSIFIDTLGNTKMYHKKHLVPFAEHIPLSGVFPSLKKLNFGQANFTHGKEFTTFNLGSTKFSNVICYESSVPQLLRGFVKNGAQFITIEANDGWLGKSSGPYQHFELAKLRAVENRVTIARSANTGISGIINAIGVVENCVPLGEKKILIAEILPSQKLTFYTKYGEIFALFCVLITFTILVTGCIKNTD